MQPEREVPFRENNVRLAQPHLWQQHCNDNDTGMKNRVANFAAMKTKSILLFCTLVAVSLSVKAQTPGDTLSGKAQTFSAAIPEIHGTLRGKYEYQTREGEGRFEVRTARVSVTGRVIPEMEYKAEIDLCDEGEIKMLDAYARLKPWKDFRFTIGQMRVPFTIDAHRSPDKQYFANRSFIAKQVGNIRDVGAMISYNISAGFPVTVEAGLFNGSGLTNQKDYWTKGVNFSAKTQLFFTKNLTLTLSAQKINPDSITVMMYDGGLTWRCGGFIAEAEYLFKTYAHDAYKNVHAADVFASYDIPVRKSLIKKVSPLVRYDFMTDHSNGKRNADRRLFTNDYRRHRLTAGTTLSLAKPFRTDIRLNFEKYFYRHDGIPKISERDKIVIELMTHF